MATMVSKKRRKSRATRPLIGRQILDVLTTGMYNNPLMILREYIQNSTDSIDESISNKNKLSSHCINISINPKDREVIIFDNGCGVPKKDIKNRLGSLGLSTKENTNARGFRGIGRLGGLSYCDALRFETRTRSTEPVSIVEWDNRALTNISSNSRSLRYLSDVIAQIVKYSSRPATKEDPARFFRVTMKNIHSFHRDVLMDSNIIRNYLMNTAPLPFHPDKNIFTFGNDLDSFLAPIPTYRVYNIYLNGEQLYKPYSNKIQVSTNQIDWIKDIKKIKFTNPSTDELIGLGWFAISSFKSSLPKSVIMRGLRVKHGNIEVGDERFLEDFYTEKRFATWHIGEIHLNHNIKPNARRDGFEANYDYERFLERMTFIGKGLSNLCRESSLKRCAKVRIDNEISSLEKSTAINTIIDEDHKNKVYMKALESIETINKIAKSQDMIEEIGRKLKYLHIKVEKINSTETIYDRIDGRKVTNITQKDLLREVCNRIITFYQKDISIEEILEKALSPFFKS